MTQFRVLISAPYFLPVVDEYRARFEAAGCSLVVADVQERLGEDELLRLIPDIDAALCGDDAFTRRVMSQAPRLKVIAKWGTGIDSIDQHAAADLKIQVKNTPDAFSVPVADSVFGYMLTFARRIPWMDRAMKSGHWEKIPGRSLAECTLGIVGVGNVGKAVARRARAFGMRVLGNDIRDADPDWESLEVTMVELDQLLRDSDFVSINCCLTQDNKHLIGKAELEKMKDTAVLINTARGPLVEEVALVSALREQKIAGVALDVFEDEPLPASSGLRAFDNALLAPHNSNSSPTAWRRVHESTVAQLLDVLGKAT